MCLREMLYNRYSLPITVLLPLTLAALAYLPQSQNSLRGDAVDVSTEVKPTESKETQDLRKRAWVPEIDPDGLPSSYAMKMATCATKHVKKLSDLIHDFGDIEDPTQTQTRSPS